MDNDAQQVIKLWDMAGHERTQISRVLREIRQQSGHFANFTLSFISWEGNEVAHLCAKQATNLRRRCMWLNYTPLSLVIIFNVIVCSTMINKTPYL